MLISLQVPSSQPHSPTSTWSFGSKSYHSHQSPSRPSFQIKPRIHINLMSSTWKTLTWTRSLKTCPCNEEGAHFNWHTSAPHNKPPMHYPTIPHTTLRTRLQHSNTATLELKISRRANPPNKGRPTITPPPPRPTSHTNPHQHHQVRVLGGRPP